MKSFSCQYDAAEVIYYMRNHGNVFSRAVLCCWA